MIVLITGASHTGKTMLAQKLLEKCMVLCKIADRSNKYDYFRKNSKYYK